LTNLNGHAHFIEFKGDIIKSDECSSSDICTTFVTICKTIFFLLVKNNREKKE